MLEEVVNEGDVQAVNVKEDEASFVRKTCDSRIVKEQLMQIERESLKQWQCSRCNKRYRRYSNFIRHINIVHRKIKEAKCETCDKQFTRKEYLNRHLKDTKSHNRLVPEEFQFDSFITEHSPNQHVWEIGEKLMTAREQPTNNEFTINILKNSETIVGHTPPELNRSFTALLISGGNVTVKVTADPVKSMIRDTRIPCTYIVKGKRTFVQDIKVNLPTNAATAADTFRCLMCGPPNGPPSGCPPEYHDKKCTFRQ